MFMSPAFNASELDSSTLHNDAEEISIIFFSRTLFSIQFNSCNTPCNLHRGPTNTILDIVYYRI